MPADDGGFVRIWFLRDVVILNRYPIIGWYLTYISFDDFPQVLPSFGQARQKSLNAIMTGCPIQHVRQTCSRGQFKRTDMIVSVNIE